MKFFLYDHVNEKIVLNDESIILIREFEALLDDKRGGRERAFREFKFIYLYLDWESPYFQFSEKEKYEEALLDSQLTQDELEDKKFKAACKKYDEIQNSSKVGKLLQSSYNTIDKITLYLNTLDLNERDPQTGKPIFKTKDVITEISSASKLVDAIRTLEIQFKKDTETDTSLRGDKTPGMFDRG